MPFYYIEIKDGKIASYGETIGVNEALQKTGDQVIELTEAEYKMVSACRGILERGKGLLDQVKHKIEKDRE